MGDGQSKQTDNQHGHSVHTDHQFRLWRVGCKITRAGLLALLSPNLSRRGNEIQGAIGSGAVQEGSVEESPK